MNPGALRWISYGADAGLVEFASAPGEAAFERARLLRGVLADDPMPGVGNVVFGATRVLFEFRDGLGKESLKDRVLEGLCERLAAAAAFEPAAALIREIPVQYGGPDLARVATLAGLSEAEVCARHCRGEYRVDVLGFAPGFAYLGGLDPTLRTPRLEKPRPRVEAGWVAIGGVHTGVYPIRMPGGWNLIGRTTMLLFDRRKAEGVGDVAAAFALAPGDRVRFVPA